MNSTNSFWYLEEVDLFECFCPVNGAEDRYDKQPKKTIKKGEFIYLSDDEADKVFFIHKGAVKIAGYTQDGDEIIKAILHPGEIFGELAVFGAENRNDYAQTVEDTDICVLNREQVVGLMRDVNGFQQFINKLVGQRVIMTQKRMASLLYKDAKARIAEYIYDQSKKSSRETRDGITLRNYLTHQEIANYTGTSRQTVTTILNQLREQELIDFDRKRITIKDMSAFKRLVV
ncbi:MAG: Crp/Fnr family transcriptional regulator [Bacteroidota bacterium]